MRTLLFVFAFQLTALATAFGQLNYYTVKFPDDQTVIGCNAGAPVIWPEITNSCYCAYNVGVSMSDMVFNINATGGCKKILRTWRLLWWCDYSPNWPINIVENPGNTDIGATTIGNSFNHGYLQYVQVIKIVDNVAPVFLDCPTTSPVFCDYSTNDPLQYNTTGVDYCEGPINLHVRVTDLCSKSDVQLSYRLYLDLDGNGTMETYRSSSEPGAWPIERTVTADTVFAKIKLPSGVGLPYAKHKVEWIANDGCGNQTLCKYEFTVKDCSPPSLICYNGLGTNIMPPGMVTLWDTDFPKYVIDNCTPTAQIKLGIRKVGAGIGFPETHSVTFDCTEIGKNYVEIWAIDASGNAGYCVTYVIVQDHIGTCPPPSNPLMGHDNSDQTLSPAGTETAERSDEKELQILQNQTDIPADRLVFYPVVPNPTDGPMQISYWLPTAGPVTLTLTTANGRVLKTTTANQRAGYQQTDLQATEPGVLFLRLQWAGGAEVRRVVVQR